MHPEKIEIRLCLPYEIKEVIKINAQWQRDILDGNLSNGFVTGNIDANYLKEVIDRNEIVIALDNTSVVGYAMLNDIEHAPINHSKIQEMLDRGLLLSSVNVGLATQAAVKLAYHGKGITTAMLKTLANSISDKYDIMVSSINKLNRKSLLAHQNKNGWTVYDEDLEHIYVYYPLHEKEKKKYFFKQGSCINTSK